ncbi:hypothetical protein C8F01DRAFT_1229604, partial [Mycena amicta]
MDVQRSFFPPRRNETQFKNPSSIGNVFSLPQCPTHPTVAALPAISPANSSRGRLMTALSSQGRARVDVVTLAQAPSWTLVVTERAWLRLDQNPPHQTKIVRTMLTLSSLRPCQPPTVPRLRVKLWIPFHRCPWPLHAQHIDALLPSRSHRDPLPQVALRTLGPPNIRSFRRNAPPPRWPPALITRQPSSSGSKRRNGSAISPPRRSTRVRASDSTSPRVFPNRRHGPSRGAA